MGDSTVDVVWENFVNDNEEIMRGLDRCASDCNDIIANVATIYNNMDAFSNNEYLPALGDDLSGALETLNTCTLNLGHFFEEKVYKIIELIYTTEHELEAYSSDGSVEGSDILGTVLTIASGIGFALGNTNKFKALGFFLGYGTDALNGFESCIGDGASKLVWTGWNLVKDMFLGKSDPIAAASRATPYWINCSVGTVAVGLVTYFVERLTDEGEFTTYENWKAWYDAAGAGLGYCAWAAIAGSVGGPGGALLATWISMTFGAVWNIGKAVLFGEEIIYRFELDGETYEVPGRGKEYKIGYDVFLDRYNKSHTSREYELNGENVTESVYKDEMYYFLTNRRTTSGESFSSAYTDFTKLHLYDGQVSERQMNYLLGWINDNMDRIDEYCGDNVEVFYGYFDDLISGDLQAREVYYGLLVSLDEFNPWELYHYIQTGEYKEASVPAPQHHIAPCRPPIEFINPSGQDVTI
jgi:hypothetical protein